jgi:hypothetical protein
VTYKRWILKEEEITMKKTKHKENYTIEDIKAVIKNLPKPNSIFIVDGQLYEIKNQ